MQRKREQVNREGKNKSDNIKNPKKKEFLKGEVFLFGGNEW